MSDHSTCNDCRIELIPPVTGISDLFGRKHCQYCYEISQITPAHLIEIYKHIFLFALTDDQIDELNEGQIEKIGHRKPCYLCKGKGRYQIRSGETTNCHRCKTSGILIGTLCPDCDGTMQAYHDCGCDYCDREYVDCDKCRDGIYYLAFEFAVELKHLRDAIKAIGDGAVDVVVSAEMEQSNA